MPDVTTRPPARWGLPDNPDLGWLRTRAKRLRRQAAAGGAEALALVATYDPPGPDRAGHLTLARAQRVLARAFGFPSWTALRAHLRTIDAFSRSPEPADPDNTSEALPDRLLRLACLSYTRYDVADRTRAEALLAADPTVASASVWTLAATGRATELAARLASDPGAVNADGGPYRWPPLLYLCYARLGSGRGDPVGAARALLAAGADPDAGFLWHGLTSPFTALTGVFGGGERGEPPHPDALPLARLLLDHGADPNDNQTLYDRMFTPDDSHLELLFAYGLGTPRPSVWRDRLGSAYPSATAMVGEQLRHAAEHGFTDRVRLLLAHGVDPDTTGYHPLLGDQTPYELAVRLGHRAAAELLAAGGASPGRVDDADRWLAAVLDRDEVGAAALAARTPGVVTTVARRRPGAVQEAVEHGHLAALDALLAAGLDVDGVDRFGATGLHQAALDGRDAVVDLLLARGADPAVRDRRFDATPAGWADHAGHRELAARLAALEPPG